MNTKTVSGIIIATAIWIGCLGGLLIAQANQFPEVLVIGTTESDIKQIPGSAAVITSKQLTQSKPTNGNEALRKVSGVYVRDEDGLGLRPNIGIRGLDDDRSRKVLLLEDGVPIALAPYGESSAYYAPQIDRMDRVEVLKGSGSILYGPQTVGGVINYITKPIPKEQTTTATLELGSNTYSSYDISYGNTFNDTGVMVNFLHKQGDGPRDPMPFKIYDLSSKFHIPLSNVSNLSLKLHYYNEDAHVTYQGLTQTEFNEDPGQNTAKNDVLLVERLGVSAVHNYFGWDELSLKTTGYAYYTKRHWWRQDVAGIDGNGHKTYKNSNGGRNRDYKVVGIEPRFEYKNWEGGARLHYETEENQRINGASATARSGVINQDETRSTIASALYGQYRWDVNPKWQVVPGLRIESFKQYRDVHIKKGGTHSETEGATDITTELIPGIGTTYDVTPNTTLFAGVHRGFAPPRFADAINSSGEDQKLDAERSVNYEVGVRSKMLRDHVEVSATAFVIDYENQVVASSASSGVDVVNGGETLHKGVELDVAATIPNVGGTGWEFRPSLALSLIDARFEGDRKDESTTLNYDGEELPYSPNQLWTLGLGLSKQKWTLFLEGVFVGETNGYEVGEDQVTVGDTASADGEKGPIGAYTVWNFTVNYDINKEWSTYAAAKNLFDETYIASRRPEGIFPGPERQFLVGLQKTW